MSTDDEVNEIAQLHEEIVSLKIVEANLQNELSKVWNTVGGIEEISSSLSLGGRWPVFETKTTAENWIDNNIFRIIHNHLKEVTSSRDYEKLANTINDFKITTIGSASLSSAYPN